MIGNSWDIYLKEEFQKDYFKELLKQVQKEYKEKTCYPPQNEIFNAFRYTKYEDQFLDLLHYKIYLKN